MIAIEAFLFFLLGICTKFLIEILFFAKIFVIEDKTPGLSLTSILKYDDVVCFKILNFEINDQAIIKGFNTQKDFNSL